jgi:type II secretory pathway component PulF
MPIEMQTVPAAASVNKAAGKTRLSDIHLFGVKGPNHRDRSIFTEQLALMLETGMPLHTSLESMQQQAGNAAMKSVIDDLLAEVQTGQRFSAALAKHPQLFSSTYVSIVASSESSGFLHKALEHLQAEEEKRDELRKTVKSALSYPIFLVGFSVLVVIFVLVGVFPKFAVMFERIRDQLPPTTIALMWASDALRVFWWQILLVMGSAAVLTARWVKSSAGRLKIDHWKLTLPGLRTVFVQLYVTQSFRAISLSLNHGVTIVESLAATRDVVDNHFFKTLLLHVEKSVQEGGTVAAAFAESAFIPDLVKQMVATAEVSGNMALVLGRIASHYEREFNRRLDALSKMAEPVMLLVMGVVVGTIVSSLILPIFKLSKAVS